jgi:hypothetical protein
MSVDYPLARDIMLPSSFGYATNSHSAIVVHKTAGDTSLASIFNSFSKSGKSVHYAIDLDGSVGQLIPESKGAGGNCCVESGYDTFWAPYLKQYGDLNLCTISIEHIDPTSDNSYVMPQAQVDASHKLIKYLADKYNIANSNIKGHNTIDPISRKFCPGPTYDFQALFNYLGGTQEQTSVTVTTLFGGGTTTVSFPDLLNNVPGFLGIVESLDESEQFYPLRIQGKSTDYTIGDSVVTLPTLQAPSEGIGEIILFLALNTRAALIRGCLILLGLFILIALIRNVVSL